MSADPLARRLLGLVPVIVVALIATGGCLRGLDERSAPEPEGGMPHRLIVERTNTDAVVTPVAMGDDRSLPPPEDPKHVGWWRDGPRPGSATGTAVLTGHAVHEGGGVFDDLERLRLGDRIRLITDRGTLDYRVNRVDIVDQLTLAREATALFAADGPARLALVTCENWNGRSFDDNLVVIATPT